MRSTRQAAPRSRLLPGALGRTEQHEDHSLLEAPLNNALLGAFGRREYNGLGAC